MKQLETFELKKKNTNNKNSKQTFKFNFFYFVEKMYEQICTENILKGAVNVVITSQ